MQAILYIGHGTRLQKGVEEAIQFIEETKKFIQVPIQETAFLELVEPSIIEGVKKCIERGATDIAIIPILLLEAQHAKVDIPEEIDKARQLYPTVHFSIGKPLGVHENLIDEIYYRIKEQGKPISKNAEVLLIGRGSSDTSVVRSMNEIAQRLKQKYGFLKVSYCFLYGTGPSFETALHNLKLRQPKQTFIVPYLLFSGLLRNSIQKKIESLEIDAAQFVLCESLGYKENVRQVLLERINEVIKLGD